MAADLVAGLRKIASFDTGLAFRIEEGVVPPSSALSPSSDAIQRGPNPDPIAERVNPQTTVGSKAPVNQRELPQTVAVVTQDEIVDRSMRTIDDAMRYAPGVTTEVNQPGFTSYYSRGFPISTVQFDSSTAC